jgi:hypothetical protein
LLCSVSDTQSTENPVQESPFMQPGFLSDVMIGLSTIRTRGCSPALPMNAARPIVSRVSSRPGF